VWLLALSIDARVLFYRFDYTSARFISQKLFPVNSRRYSKKNQAYLVESIAELEAGEGEKHDIIDV